METMNQVSQDLSMLPYHSPNIIEYGNSRQFLEPAETAIPAKHCKPTGSGDVFGSGLPPA
jgi:hypothetical protein